MKKIVMLAALLLPGALFAQNLGIQFTEYESWRQLLERAKAQHKNIFVDAYTTWCGPCKRMDAEVYHDAKLRNYVNDHFIAVKIQFDKTDHDSEGVKRWYNIASELQKKYTIDAFPTLLFISPDDELFCKIVGFYSADVLLNSIVIANDPQGSFLSKMTKYSAGSLPIAELPDFAIKAKDYKYDSLAFAAAKQYKLKVIDKTRPEKIVTPQLHVFMIYFGDLFTVNDQMSEYIYAYPQSADRRFKGKYSRQFIEYLATRTYIDPLMFPNGKYIDEVPDWKLMEKSIRLKYDEDLAYKLTLGTKISYYSRKKDWQNTIRYMIDRTDYLGLDTSAFGALNINNMVYNVIFKYSTNISQLRRGIEYMRVLLAKEKDNYIWIDTYANMLYKVGMRQQAISEQERAVALAMRRNDTDVVKELNLALDKMQKNTPTWPE